MMRATDLEKVEHYTKELKRLEAAKRLLENGAVHAKLYFYRDGEPTEESPFVQLDAGDKFYQPVYTLALAQVHQDISEVLGILRSLGVEAA